MFLSPVDREKNTPTPRRTAVSSWWRSTASRGIEGGTAKNKDRMNTEHFSIHAVFFVWCEGGDSNPQG